MSEINEESQLGPMAVDQDNHMLSDTDTDDNSDLHLSPSVSASCCSRDDEDVRNGRLRVPNMDIPTRILMRYIVPRVDVAYTSERYL